MLLSAVNHTLGSFGKKKAYIRSAQSCYHQMDQHQKCTPNLNHNYSTTVVCQHSITSILVVFLHPTWHVAKLPIPSVLADSLGSKAPDWWKLDLYGSVCHHCRRQPQQQPKGLRKWSPEHYGSRGCKVSLVATAFSENWMTHDGTYLRVFSRNPRNCYNLWAVTVAARDEYREVLSPVHGKSKVQSLLYAENASTCKAQDLFRIITNW